MLARSLGIVPTMRAATQVVKTSHDLVFSLLCFPVFTVVSTYANPRAVGI